MIVKKANATRIRKKKVPLLQIAKRENATKIRRKKKGLSLLIVTNAKKVEKTKIKKKALLLN